MADVKNFGLVGVGSNVQFGKAGSKIVLDQGTFKFRNASNASDVALTAAGITSSGAISAASGFSTTTGGLTLTASDATVSIGGDTTISRQGAGVVKFDGSAAVMLPVGNTAPTGATGMIRVNNTTASAAIVEYFNGTAWTTLATGGNAQALQDEVNAIETTLGSLVNADGTTNVAGALTNALFGGATNLTTALNNLASGVNAKDTLDEIFASTAAGNVIYSTGANTWAQAAPGATSGVQGYDAGLAALAAKTSTGIMVQTGDDTYTSRSLVAPAAGFTIADADGVAGAPTFALSNDLAALEGLASTGFAVRTANDTWAQRKFVAPAAGITITNDDGVAGNVTLALANDLAALEGLTTVGYMVRTGDGTATTRSMSVVVGDLAITGAADGVSTDTTFGLATVTQANSGNFVKVTLDTKGRVTGNTAVTTADITALVDATYVNVTGDTMTGDLDFGGTKKVTGLAAPTAGGDATNKAYVDNLVTGLTWKNAVRTLVSTEITLSGEQTAGGVALVAGDRVLVVGQTTDDTENGIYVVASGAWTRATDAASYTQLNGASVFVSEGPNADSAWTQITELTSAAGQEWVQFSGAGAYSGGTGISVNGTTISVDLGAGIIDLPTGQVGIDLYGVASSALILTTDGTTSSTDAAAKLALNLDAAGGLAQTSSGLKIAAGGVANAMLAHSSFTINADSGTDTLSLGDTFEVRGTSAQGISTTVAESPAGTSTFTITAADASSSQKGVATFNTASFAVTSGDVTIKTAGVGNSQLANSTISFTGTSGSDAVALGETLTVTGTNGITTAVTANAISIDLGTVAIGNGGTGKTSFNANQIHYGDFLQSSLLSFDATTAALTLGSSTITGGVVGNPDLTITAATGGDISLVPASGQSVIIAGSVGDSTIQSDAGTALTVRGNTTLTLESGTGSTSMKLATGTTAKVNVSGPTAADYATGLADTNLVNKYYVDTAIQTGAAQGSIKAVKLALSGDGTTNIGAAMPAGATVLSVKLQVTTANAATTVSVGNVGSAGAYMADTENDPSTTGMYVAETYVTEASATQATVTVANSGANPFVGNVIVQYQVA